MPWSRTSQKSQRGAGCGQGDPIFTDSHGNLLKDQLDRQERIRAYAGDGDLKDPLLSPLWAKDFAGLPPMMLLAADEDLTVDDSVELANKAKHDGVEVDLVVWPRMWHDCPLPSPPPATRPTLSPLASSWPG